MTKSFALLPILAAFGLAGCASPRVTTTTPLQFSRASISDSSAAVALYGGSGNDYVRGIHCDSSGCMIYGRTDKSFTPEEDFLVIRTSPSGTPVWARAYGGTNNDNLRSATTTRDGGALLIGYSYSLFYTSLKVFSPHKPQRPLLIRIGANGKIKWAETVDLSGVTYRLRLNQAVQTAAGGFLLAGYYQDWTEGNGNAAFSHWMWTGKGSAPPPGAPQDAILVRIDRSGKIEWLKRYQVSSGKYAHDSKAWSILPRSEGNFLVALYDASDVRIVLLTIDGAGKPIGAYNLEGAGKIGPSDLAPLPSGGFLLLGREHGDQGAIVATLIASFDKNAELRGLRRYGQSNFTPLEVIKSGAQRYCVAGRNGKGLQSQAAALSFSLRDHLSRVLAVHTDAIAEFFDVTEAPAGGCLLGGSTKGFSAAKIDMMTFDWHPETEGREGPDGEPVSGAHLEKADVSAIQPDFDVSSVVHGIPADDIRITTIPVPSAQSSADPVSK